MRPDFVEYLKGLGMGDVLVERVESIERSVLAVCPEDTLDLFVGEYIDEDGNRQYEKVFFFTNHYVVESRDFKNTNQFEIDYVRGSIINLKVTADSFDFLQPTDQSRLNVQHYATGELRAEFKASRENCSHLLEIVRRYLVPNLGATTEEMAQ